MEVPMLHVNDINQFISDGKIDYGRMVRHYRKEIMHWTNAAILADLLNEFLDGEEVSDRWIQRMEKDNKVPIDKKRRWLIATLLNIPPAYLGLKIGKSLFPPYDAIKLLIPAEISPIDVDEYECFLRSIWAVPYQNTDAVLMRIYQLQHASLFSTSSQKGQIERLLCEYLIGGANMQRAQGFLNSAIRYLDDAIALSEEKTFFDLEAKAHYLRGYCYYEIYGISSNKQAYQHTMLQAIIDAQIAVDRLEEAKRKKLCISPSFAGAAYQQKGEVLTYNVQDEADRTKSLGIIDQGGRIITNNTEKDPYFFSITPEWYHIGKAQAYIALGWSNSALNDLRYLTGDPRQMRRFLTANIAEAQAYAVSGKIETAVAYAEVALEVASEVHAELHLAHIASLYQTLRQDKKGISSTDVARLGVQILKVQHPEVFL
jgi:tetratricopeptide (TPR) repeat protein